MPTPSRHPRQHADTLGDITWQDADALGDIARQDADALGGRRPLCAAWASPVGRGPVAGPG
ncbi:hypothetical protein GCM10023196_092580 [Actinoallomurus vinaceus]|uniref:Uncharacterized protein n=1 Tax=Actinoallomurus vinaceus TaxID=1080074 RepID=A0ABP8UTI2_9ACTN